jgi:hypothetical protein
MIEVLNTQTHSGNVSGNIRFKLAGDTAIKKVSSVYDPIEKILGK